MTERLAMNSHASRWLKPEDRAAIERAIPDGYRMTVMYGTAPGDWSIRIFKNACLGDSGLPSDDALVVIKRHQRTIKGGAYVALAKLAASMPMTVTVDLEGEPTLVGWEPKP